MISYPTFFKRKETQVADFGFNTNTNPGDLRQFLKQQIAGSRASNNNIKPDIDDLYNLAWQDLLKRNKMST